MASFLFSILTLIVATVSQSTICIWNSTDSLRLLNGEYELQNNTHNNQSYWTQTNTDCISSPNTIYAAKYGFTLYWIISPTITSDLSEVHNIPICGHNGPPYTLPTNPTECSIGYYNNNIKLPLTITTGSCPTLTCDNLDITNTPINCNGIFERDYTQYNLYNVYKNIISDVFLYFNHYTFKWYCSETLSLTDCTDDEALTHYDISSLDPEWKDFESSRSFILKMTDMNNEIYNAKFQCIDTYVLYIDPTLDPTIEPTIESTLESTSVTRSEILQIPTMLRALDLLFWYIIAGLLCIICVILIILKQCIRLYRIVNPPKIDEEASIVILGTPTINPPIASDKSIDIRLSGPMPDLPVSSLEYGVYQASHFPDAATLKLTGNKTETLEMINNALYAGVYQPHIEPEMSNAETYDIQEETLDTNETFLHSSSPTTLPTRSATIPMLTLQGDKSPDLRSTHVHTNTNRSQTGITTSSIDDIYGRYNPESRKTTAGTRIVHDLGNSSLDE